VKVIIQIPCYNEEATLPRVLDDLPRALPGVDVVEYLVIDDGSTDRTAAVARRSGAHHVLSLPVNAGCGAAFTAGLRHARRLGARIIVNTDGDHQYRGACIGALIKPIMEASADIVVGCRPIPVMDEFSWMKKRLQYLGSAVVSRISRTDVPDVTSGFRAFSAEAAHRLELRSLYSHTLETIIQAGCQGLRIGHVPVDVNPPTRESRLIRSTGHYLLRSGMIILRSYYRCRRGVSPAGRTL